VILLTGSQLDLLRWFTRDDGQLGECHGPEMDFLLDNLLVCECDPWRTNHARGGLFRWFQLTDYGWDIVSLIN